MGGALPALILSGCVPASSGSVGVVTSHPAAASPSRDAFHSLIARSRDLGPVSPARSVSFLLLLRDTSGPRLESDLAATYDPHSPRFGRFLRPRQLRRYGPRSEAVTGIRRSLHRLGLTTSWSPGDTWLSVQGAARRMERVFGVRPHLYQALDGLRFVASARDPAIPASVRSAVSGTSHLESYTYVEPHDVPSGGLTPSDLVKAYDIAPLRNQGLDGSGQTVVFFEIDGYRQSDFDSYTNRFHLLPMHPVIRAGPQLPVGGEASMDLEAVHAIAPGARLIVYNLDQQALSQRVNSDAEFLSALVGFQRKIVNENPGAIVSNSVGSCAGVLGSGAAAALRQIYDRADALGEAWFAASGDSGAYDCLQALEQPGDPPSRRDIGVDLPASAPGVTGVGGTRLSVRTDGSWYAEEAWEGPAETAGGGGGVSTYFSRPAWQRAAGVGNTAYDPSGMREVPDVSAIADPATSGVYAIGGSYVREGGTSQAAPIWAGIMALVDQYLARHGGHKLGFANPALYALARTSQPYPPYHDVTLGSNLAYPATPGYDMASGLGTPDAWNLARDLLAYQGGPP